MIKSKMKTNMVGSNKKPNFFEVFINGQNFFVENTLTILETCKYVGIIIPRFCYHEILNVAGNCRMCLVEVEGIEKPVVSCVTEIENNMFIQTETPFVFKARQNIVASLLINHPLDCPICDQAGECDLQDQSKYFGNNNAKYFFNKKFVEDKNCNPLIKTIMTRCILCTRCVRYGVEVAGVQFFGSLNRGELSEITNYIQNFYDSEISSNVVDLCPVGALNSKNYSFKARSWELKLTETIDTSDSFLSDIYVETKGTDILSILPRSYHTQDYNLITDKARNGYDANKLNRIEKLSVNGVECEYSDFFKDFKNIIKNYSLINIFIDSDIDSVSLDMLNSLRYMYSSKIRVCLTDKVSNNSNLIIKERFSIDNLLKDVQSCFLIGTNPKLESAILNYKLRQKYKKTVCSFHVSGQIFEHNIPATFINLNIEKTTDLFEGRYILFSKLLISHKNNLVIVGQNIAKRIKNVDNFILTLKTNFPNLNVMYLKSYTNSEGVSYYDFPGVTRKTINSCKEKSTFNIAVNLKNTELFETLFKNTDSKNNLFLTTHFSKSLNKFSYIVPISTYLEDVYTYINFEGIPKTTTKINSIYKTKPLYSVLSSLFDFKQYYTNMKNLHMMVVEYLLKNPKIITQKNVDVLKNSYILKLKQKYLFKTKINSYPIKPIFKDFYKTTKFLENSNVLRSLSYKKKKLNKGWFIKK